MTSLHDQDTRIQFRPDRAVDTEQSIRVPGVVAPARDDKDQRATPGIDRYACDTDLMAAETGEGRGRPGRAYLTWLDGYMAGLRGDGRDRYDRLADIDPGILARSLEAYCIGHPHDRFADAAGRALRGLAAGHPIGAPRD